jgi:hypothetical protein
MTPLIKYPECSASGCGPVDVALTAALMALVTALVAVEAAAVVA